ncbi:hypothetical protein CEXT_144851 [Caerostris extrusa]|uniref:Uncharacterized protein n=1 Tax=Caerostris extrusa TaxID=172846 RepID=A0AAV4X080_CAEEX|nr:hypothetical protein CEXT_144851 [Caerostris extrusa]
MKKKEKKGRIVPIEYIVQFVPIEYIVEFTHVKYIAEFAHVEYIAEFAHVEYLVEFSHVEYVVEFSHIEYVVEFVPIERRDPHKKPHKKERRRDPHKKEKEEEILIRNLIRKKEEEILIWFLGNPVAGITVPCISSKQTITNQNLRYSLGRFKDMCADDAGLVGGLTSNHFQKKFIPGAQVLFCVPGIPDTNPWVKRQRKKGAFSLTGLRTEEGISDTPTLLTQGGPWNKREEEVEGEGGGVYLGKRYLILV